ncbi:MAG: hypothetical protein WA738_15565 [Candidatus Angelobacter sp.]
MKLLRLNTSIVVLGLGILCGCQHKKPVLVVPQQPPSTVAPEPTPTPAPEPSQAQQADQQQAQPAQPPTEQTQAEKAQKDKPKHAKKPSPRKPAPASGDKPEVAHNKVPTTVVKPGPEPTPPEGQISPGPTTTYGAQDKTSTEQLLQSAETNLNGIKRQLSKDEEAMREQIREFITQSRKATTENDLARAHNFALKARLLSDDLIKQR